MHSERSLHSAFSHVSDGKPCFWFMRQAGRYLAEYREVRAECGDFLSLCYAPRQAAEVTAQPIRRFGMDAAIIFSDILVIPHAMGRDLSFAAGEGPRLNPVTTYQDAESLHQETDAFLEPVYEAIRQTRQMLPPETSLIGFAGSPWTLACYMLQGRGGEEFVKARAALYEDPAMIKLLLARLVDAVARHMCNQVRAGADVLQLFDSWAGLVPSSWQEEAIYRPTAEIVRRVKKEFPHIPIIGFPKGIGNGLSGYVRITGVDGVGIDSFTSLDEACKAVPEQCLIQGNLDPLLLASSKEETLAYAAQIMEKMRQRKFIFNLGHGIVPQTPVHHVAALSAFLKEPRKKGKNA